MANGIGWDETTPSDTESAGLGDDRIRSLKTSLRQALDDEHNYPSSGGDNVGYHKYGSARPHYGTQSRVSSAGTDGKLMMTSDTSRLFGVGSGGTVLIGGPGVVSLATFPGTVPQRHHWVEEVGAGFTNSVGNLIVTFPSGFSGLPYVFASLVTTGNTSGGYAAGIHSLTASGCTISVFQTNDLSSAQSRFVQWRSLGTRVL